jgi:hypothetical protein
MPDNDNSARATNAERAHEGSDSNRLRNLLVSSGLSSSEAARALSVEEKTLLYWCQPNGKLLPPRWAIDMLGRMVAMKRKSKL